jgi:nitrite reductase/ring-hydroxylating ferredoxin subunit/DMSO/TMAO reductase YedYZ heme-binding membrane subunit
MSHAYRFVGWNRQKKVYDRTLLAAVLLYLAVFVGLGAWLRPNATVEILLIRAFGTAALLLLHVVLSLGPLARLDPRFLPLVYNRRHLGVTMCALALVHGGFSLIQFHALGNSNPLVSLFTANSRYASLAQFPFESLGFAALLILCLMAATSHDFWLANLTPPVWKTLHMMVYVAYGLLVVHVALGALQAERHPALVGLLGLGGVWVLGLHLVAGWRERAGDRELDASSGEVPAADFVEVCRVGDIREKRARIVCLSGERVAVFRYDGKISAVSNVCQHQNGPLGEGRIIDGCITCPWHGFQYQPENGASPPPFTEKVPTFGVRLDGDRVFVDRRPYPPGTPVEPAVIGRPGEGSTAFERDFYVGYRPQAAPALGGFLHRVSALLLLTAVVVAAALALLQGPFDPGVFEYGVNRDFSGVIAERPYPVLVADPAVGIGSDAASSLLLVAAGKHGAATEVRGLDGRRAGLQGSLIYRQGQAMIEVAAGSAEARASAAPAAVALIVDLGIETLRGEIVDSKCFLGVMKPGRGKTHRACAARCISGGIPPVLRVETADGDFRDFLLTDANGDAVNARVLDFVAEPIEITGSVRRQGDVLILAADPAAYRRL